MHDPLIAAVERLVFHLEQIARHLEAHMRQSDNATKRDLDEMERRVLAAVDGRIAKEDQAALDNILKRTERSAKKLEALDAKTPKS